MDGAAAVYASGRPQPQRARSSSGQSRSFTLLPFSTKLHSPAQPRRITPSRNGDAGSSSNSWLPNSAILAMSEDLVTPSPPAPEQAPFSTGKKFRSPSLPKRLVLQSRDKESLLDEIISLKRALTQQAAHLKRHKARALSAGVENRKLEKDIEALEVKGSTEAPRTGGPSRLRAKLQGMKMHIEQLQTTCDSQQEEIGHLHRDIRVTRTREMEAERNVFAEEVLRLQKAIKRLKASHDRVSCENRELCDVKAKASKLEAANQRLETCVEAVNKTLERANYEVTENRNWASELNHHVKMYQTKYRELEKHLYAMADLLEQEKIEKQNSEKKVTEMRREVQKLEAMLMKCGDRRANVRNAGRAETWVLPPEGFSSQGAANFSTVGSFGKPPAHASNSQLYRETDSKERSKRNNIVVPKLNLDQVNCSNKEEKSSAPQTSISEDSTISILPEEVPEPSAPIPPKAPHGEAPLLSKDQGIRGLAEEVIEISVDRVIQKIVNEDRKWDQYQSVALSQNQASNPVEAQCKIRESLPSSGEIPEKGCTSSNALEQGERSPKLWVQEEAIEESIHRAVEQILIELKRALQERHSKLNNFQGQDPPLALPGGVKSINASKNFTRKIVEKIMHDVHKGVAPPAIDAVEDPMQNLLKDILREVEMEVPRQLSSRLAYNQLIFEDDQAKETDLGKASILSHEVSSPNAQGIRKTMQPRFLLSNKLDSKDASTGGSIKAFDFGYLEYHVADSPNNLPPPDAPDVLPSIKKVHSNAHSFPSHEARLREDTSGNDPRDTGKASILSHEVSSPNAQSIRETMQPRLLLSNKLDYVGAKDASKGGSIKAFDFGYLEHHVADSPNNRPPPDAPDVLPSIEKVHSNAHSLPSHEARLREDTSGNDPRNSSGKDLRNAGGKDSRDSSSKDPRDAGGKDSRDSGGKDPRDAGGKDLGDTSGKDPGGHGLKVIQQEDGLICDMHEAAVLTDHFPGGDQSKIMEKSNMRNEEDQVKGSSSSGTITINRGMEGAQIIRALDVSMKDSSCKPENVDGVVKPKDGKHASGVCPVARNEIEQVESIIFPITSNLEDVDSKPNSYATMYNLLDRVEVDTEKDKKKAEHIESLVRLVDQVGPPLQEKLVSTASGQNKVRLAHHDPFAKVESHVPSPARDQCLGEQQSEVTKKNDLSGSFETSVQLESEPGVCMVPASIVSFNSAESIKGRQPIIKPVTTVINLLPKEEIQEDEHASKPKPNVDMKPSKAQLVGDHGEEAELGQGSEAKKLEDVPKSVYHGEDEAHMGGTLEIEPALGHLIGPLEDVSNKVCTSQCSVIQVDATIDSIAGVHAYEPQAGIKQVSETGSTTNGFPHEVEDISSPQRRTSDKHVSKEDASLVLGQSKLSGTESALHGPEKANDVSGDLGAATRNRRKIEEGSSDGIIVPDACVQRHGIENQICDINSSMKDILQTLEEGLLESNTTNQGERTSGKNNDRKAPSAEESHNGVQLFGANSMDGSIDCSFTLSMDQTTGGKDHGQQVQRPYAPGTLNAGADMVVTNMIVDSLLEKLEDRGVDQKAKRHESKGDKPHSNTPKAGESISDIDEIADILKLPTHNPSKSIDPSKGENLSDLPTNLECVPVHLEQASGSTPHHIPSSKDEKQQAIRSAGEENPSEAGCCC